MKIAIYSGDICTAPAEVICTSTNPHLDLMLGTGGAVREAGGWEIQEECHALIEREQVRTGHRYLQPGLATRTGAGNLPFRAVVHCVATDAFHGSTPAVIAACVRNALKEAAALNPPAASVALPVFASGHGRVDFEQALALMTDELKRAASDGPETVWIVAPKPEQAQAAARQLTARLGQPVKIVSTPPA